LCLWRLFFLLWHGVWVEDHGAGTVAILTEKGGWEGQKRCLFHNKIAERFPTDTYVGVFGRHTDRFFDLLVFRLAGLG
jgi:hypothetical protein